MNSKPSSPKLNVAAVDRRDAFDPKVEFPAELPISRYRDEILSLLHDHQVLVICGETGSGKSTQLPKMCLAAGFGRQAMIGHTQPRRLAARSIAARLAEEIECPLGKQVGYQVRFGDQTGPETMIKLMTDGILLAETSSDRNLRQYEVLIIDEAHERSLNIDFILAYLRQLQPKRPDLKIIITSATIDAERFASHFSSGHGTGEPAPILNVEGRGYPVEMRYLPWEDCTAAESRNVDLGQHVIEGIKELSRSGSGDALVFLPTERDIRMVSHRVAGHYKRLGLEKRVEVLPLYARLPQKDQEKIFHPDGKKQRLVFATNVAESSLTVPDIRYVIDSGTARISRYSPRSKLQRLPIEPVSQASANQRAGRCGRVGPGICVRLYSEDDYASRDAFTTPEIRRTNLASVVLQAKMLGFGSLDSLPLLDVPRDESIREGVRTLLELGALDDRHELTDVGRVLGRLPVDPRIGRIILAAEEYGVLPEVLPIAAALEIPDPRQRPQEQQQAADKAHEEFVDSESDFLAYLRLWKFYESAKSDWSRSKLHRQLVKRFISPTRMREWGDTYRQLLQIASTLPGKRTAGNKKALGKIRYAERFDRRTLEKDVFADVHRALLTGFLSGVAMAGDSHQYVGPRNLKLFLWPGSGVFQSTPKWIVAAELVETAKQYARTVAKIQPQWVEQVASHLLKDSYSDPHWSSKSNGAFCYQRRSLFGLPVVPRRRVPLPPIDPGTARDLLIEHGLVEQELVTSARFVRHNRALRESIESLAAKTRRRDLVVDHLQVLRFYQQHLPDSVSDKGRLEKFAAQSEAPPWTQQLGDAAALSRWLDDPPNIEASAGGCYMLPADLIDVAAESIKPSDFPDHLNVGKSELPLNYRFEPGGDEDGISVKVHRSAVAQISDDRLGWLVPGQLKQKLVAMIKSLPKRIRRNLVPAADVAEKLYDELMPVYGTVPFTETVCQAMSRHAEMTVAPTDLQDDKMDAHLDFLIQVVDDDGQLVMQGRRAAPLIEACGGSETSESQSPPEDETGLIGTTCTSFDLDEIPVELIRSRGGVQVAQFPALVDLGDAARVELFADRQSADHAMMQGLTRLFAISERAELKRQVRWLPGRDAALVQLSGVLAKGRWEDSLADLLARIAFVENKACVRTRNDFDEARKDRGEKIAIAVQEIAGWLTQLADNYLQMRGELESLSSPRHARAITDIRQQLAELFHPRFLSATPWQWLKHYPRYVAAISYRLEKLSAGGTQRDAVSMEELESLRTQWLDRLPEADTDPERCAADEFRWMLEELRVSLFAQPLGTSLKVSPKRCKKWLEKT